jgi:hypothetical protein
MPSAVIEIRQERSTAGRDEPGPPPLFLELLFEHDTTVREFIRRTVEEEVNTRLRGRRRAIQGKLSLLAQRSLTSNDIAEQAAKGKIGMPSANSVRREMKRASIDLRRQVERAWSAFAARDFLMTVDGVLMESLDQKVSVGVKTKVIFTHTARFFWFPK